MSIEICVLGSGSSGNSSLVRFGGRAMLIDAGFGPRSITKRLEGTGVGVEDIRAIMLTHLDRDHFNPSWLSTIIKQGIYVYCHEYHLDELLKIPVKAAGVSVEQLRYKGLLHTFTNRSFKLVCSDSGNDVAVIRPIMLAHDAEGVCGFRIEHGETHLGYATDLGHVPKYLIDAMTDVDILAIESNYDIEMQQNSGRHPTLIQRVMGNHGHLSNHQSHQAVKQILDNSVKPLSNLVILHLSKQCNDPEIVNDLFSTLPGMPERLHISTQSDRTQWITKPEVVDNYQGEQLSIFQ